MHRRHNLEVSNDARSFFFFEWCGGRGGGGGGWGVVTYTHNEVDASREAIWGLPTL